MLAWQEGQQTTTKTMNVGHHCYDEEESKSGQFPSFFLITYQRQDIQTTNWNSASITAEDTWQGYEYFRNLHLNALTLTAITKTLPIVTIILAMTAYIYYNCLSYLRLVVYTNHSHW